MVQEDKKMRDTILKHEHTVRLCVRHSGMLRDKLTSERTKRLRFVRDIMRYTNMF